MSSAHAGSAHLNASLGAEILPSSPLSTMDNSHARDFQQNQAGSNQNSYAFSQFHHQQLASIPNSQHPNATFAAAAANRHFPQQQAQQQQLTHFIHSHQPGGANAQLPYQQFPSTQQFNHQTLFPPAVPNSMLPFAGIGQPNYLDLNQKRKGTGPQSAQPAASAQVANNVKNFPSLQVGNMNQMAMNQMSNMNQMGNMNQMAMNPMNQMNQMAMNNMGLNNMNLLNFNNNNNSNNPNNPNNPNNNKNNMNQMPSNMNVNINRGQVPQQIGANANNNNEEDDDDDDEEGEDGQEENGDDDEDEEEEEEQKPRKRAKAEKKVKTPKKKGKETAAAATATKGRKKKNVEEAEAAPADKKGKKKGGRGRKSAQDQQQLLQQQQQQQQQQNDDQDDDEDEEEEEQGGRKKKKKEKQGPKRALTPFMMYSKERRPELRKANPGTTFSDIGKMIGVEWKNLDDKIKQKFIAQAQSDKDRYKHELQFFKAEQELAERHQKIQTGLQKGRASSVDVKPPKAAKRSKQDKKGVSPQLPLAPAPVVTPKQTPKQKKEPASAKKEKEKKKPAKKSSSEDESESEEEEEVKKPRVKRPTPAYKYYVRDRYVEIVKVNPKIRMLELEKMLMDQFKSLPDTSRRHYDELAQKDRQRYQQEKAELEAANAAAKAQAITDGTAKKKKKKKRGRRTKPEGAPKRPLSSFLFFLKERRPVLRRLHPNLNFSEIGKMLGNIWTDLSDAEKQVYILQAERTKMEHQQQQQHQQQLQQQTPQQLQQTGQQLQQTPQQPQLQNPTTYQ